MPSLCQLSGASSSWPGSVLKESQFGSVILWGPCVIKAVLHVVMVSEFQRHCLRSFWVYFSYPYRQTLWKRAGHVCTPVLQIHSAHPPAFCSSRRLCSIWEHRPDQKPCRSGQSSVQLARLIHGWDFSLALLKQSQSVLVPTDQCQKIAQGVMMYLLIGSALREGAKRTEVSSGESQVQEAECMLGPVCSRPAKQWRPAPQTVGHTSLTTL